MKRSIASYLLFSLLVISISSCLTDELDNKVKENETSIQNYIAVKKLSLQKTTDGMYYQITPSGTTRKPLVGDLIIYNYQLSLLNGTMIDSTASAKKQLRSFIYGGYVNSIHNYPLSFMNTGDKGVFILPFSLAFGGSSTDIIPAYSAVRLDIQIESIISQDELFVRMKKAYKMEDAQVTSTGLVWKLIKENPTGKPVQAGTSGELSYIGKFGWDYIHLDKISGAVVFDPIFDQGKLTYVANSGNLIRGFDEALQKLKVGERIQVIMPYTIGYGATGSGVIPGYAPLYFEIEINTAN